MWRERALPLLFAGAAALAAAFTPPEPLGTLRLTSAALVGAAGVVAATALAARAVAALSLLAVGLAVAPATSPAALVFAPAFLALFAIDVAAGPPGRRPWIARLAIGAAALAVFLAPSTLWPGLDDARRSVVPVAALAAIVLALAVALALYRHRPREVAP